MILSTVCYDDFNFNIVKNYDYLPMYPNNYKKINNTSCVVVWYNPIEKDFHYLIQKRSENMKSGKSKLAVGGGMLEEYDKTLQEGAVREILEESQILFRKNIKETMTKNTIKKLSKNLFYLSQDSVNVTFYLIIVSEFEPRWKGPIKYNFFPFKKSEREIDLKDKTWNSKKLKNKIYKGHAFLKKKDIELYYKKNPLIWKYSKKSLNLLFKMLEK